MNDSECFPGSFGTVHLAEWRNSVSIFLFLYIYILLISCIFKFYGYYMFSVESAY